MLQVEGSVGGSCCGAISQGSVDAAGAGAAALRPATFDALCSVSSSAAERRGQGSTSCSASSGSSSSSSITGSNSSPEIVELARSSWESSCGTQSPDRLANGSTEPARAQEAEAPGKEGPSPRGADEGGADVGLIAATPPSGDELPCTAAELRSLSLSNGDASEHGSAEVRQTEHALESKSPERQAEPERGSATNEESSAEGEAGPSDRSGSAQPAAGVPVFVMLPLDVVTKSGQVRNPKALTVALQALKSAGVEGVMVDVWWGLVEKAGPREYDWAPYIALLELVKKTGLRMQAVMSFHACGNNVGDNASIPLPAWVLNCAAQDPSLFFRDRSGNVNPECLSLFADEAHCLEGRTPLQAYGDFMRGFKDAMGSDFGSTVCEVAVGMGPCGELRYPSYPEGDGRWRFPGIGEFQCYDARALVHLRSAAQAAGEPQWGLSGPHDAGQYNLQPQQTGFFHPHGGSWDTAYGRFFLTWYSEALIEHQERMLRTAIQAFHGVSFAKAQATQQCSPAANVTGAAPEQDQSADHVTANGEAAAEAPAQASTSSSTGSGAEDECYVPAPGTAHISVKCAGIHWWYMSAAHAAELTAGYLNPRGRNGYARIVQTCRKYGAGLNFTCVEMRNCEQPPQAHCGPEELLKQVRVTAAQYGVPFAGENALARLDQHAYDQIIRNATTPTIALAELETAESAAAPAGTGALQGPGRRDAGGARGRVIEHRVPLMAAITFLRLTPQLFEERNFSRFMAFVQVLKMAGGAYPLPGPETNGVSPPGKGTELEAEHLRGNAMVPSYHGVLERRREDMTVVVHGPGGPLSPSRSWRGEQVGGGVLHSHGHRGAYPPATALPAPQHLHPRQAQEIAQMSSLSMVRQNPHQQGPSHSQLYQQGPQYHRHSHPLVGSGSPHSRSHGSAHYNHVKAAGLAPSHLQQPSHHSFHHPGAHHSLSFAHRSHSESPSHREQLSAPVHVRQASPRHFHSPYFYGRSVTPPLVNGTAAAAATHLHGSASPRSGNPGQEAQH